MSELSAKAASALSRLGLARDYSGPVDLRMVLELPGVGVKVANEIEEKVNHGSSPRRASLVYADILRERNPSLP